MFETADVCFLNSTGISNCSSCSYGSLCQFTTAYFGITSFQAVFCSIERISISTIIIVFLFSSLLNFLSIGAFCQTKARETGSGIYRLWISIIGQIGLIVIVSYILLERTNHEIVNCYLLEYLRRVLHALYDSLTACTSLERTVVIYQGVSFNKFTSRRVAKLIIPILIFYHFVIVGYQPFYRRIDHNWCILKISNSLLLNYQSAINILHFIVPYLINLILPFIWIFTLTKSKVALHKNISIWNNLKKVLTDYKHAIIANSILILFNTPRFISIFYLTCIQFQWQTTAYNIAYLLSLIPLLINLFIFVLPSPKYRPELFNFIQCLVKYRYRREYNVT